LPFDSDLEFHLDDIAGVRLERDGLGLQSRLILALALNKAWSMESTSCSSSVIWPVLASRSYSMVLSLPAISISKIRSLAFLLELRTLDDIAAHFRQGGLQAGFHPGLALRASSAVAAVARSSASNRAAQPTNDGNPFPSSYPHQ
jgi:hypothetical protein